MKAKTKRGIARLFVGIVVTGAVGWTVVSVLTTHPANNAATAETCSAATETKRAAKHLPDVLPTLSDDTTPQVMNFGQSLRPDTDIVMLPISKPLNARVSSLVVHITPFKRQDGRVLDSKHLTASAVIPPDGRRSYVELRLCVDPVVDQIEAYPGKYTGTVVIDDVRVAGGTASFTVQMKSRKTGVVVVVSLLAVLLGCIAAAGTAFAVQSNNWGGQPTLKQVLQQFPWPSVLLALGYAGTAVFTVAVAQVIRDPSWEGSVELFLTLFVTSVTAAYAACNLSRAFGAKIEVKPKPEVNNAPAAPAAPAAPVNQ